MIGPAVLAAATVDTLGRWSRRRWALAAAVGSLVVVQIARVVVAARYEPVGRPSLYAAIAVTGLLGTAALLHSPRIRRVVPSAHRLEFALPILLVVAVIVEPTGRQILEGGTTSMPIRAEEAAMIEANAADTDPGGAGEFLQNQVQVTGEPFRYFGYNGINLRTADERSRQTYQRRVMNPWIVMLLVSARATRLGLDDLQGYNPIQSARYVATMRALSDGVAQDYHDGNVLPAGLDSPLLDLFNVRYIVVPGTVPPGRPDLFHLGQRYPMVFANDQLRVLERTTAMPRAWIVHEAQTLPDEEALSALATRQRGSGASHPAFGGAADSRSGRESGGGRGSLRARGGEPDRLTTTTDAAGLLTLSDVYDPGWNAS